MKSFIKRIINYFGLDIVRYPSPLMAGLINILSTNNFNVVLDVGANNGLYAKGLRRLGYRGKIISFEPLFDPYDELKVYADSSGFSHAVINSALGEFDGISKINVSKNSVSSSILEATPELYKAAPETQVYDAKEISIMKLDTIFSKYCTVGKDKIYLKMDVQGYERNVLRGAKDSLKHIDGIQLEVALVELYRSELLFKEMVPFIEGLGFELYLLIPGFQDTKTGRLLEVDCVFLRV